MSFQTNTDNVYPEGSVITAKANPSVQLKIMKYYQRIYYCAVIGDESKKQLAYFERELISPASVK
jgi:hypothetical protein